MLAEPDLHLAEGAIVVGQETATGQQLRLGEAMLRELAALRRQHGARHSEGNQEMTMRYKSITVVPHLVGMLAAWPSSAQEPMVTAFVNIAVIPMDRERVLQNQTVLVRGKQIVALGPAKQVPVPAGARRIDGQGKFLIPGLADMHSHVRYDDRGGLFGYLANGVTTIHYEGGGGTNNPAKFRELAARGELVPPRYFGRGDFPDCKTNPRFADTSLARCFAKMKAARVAANDPVPDDSSEHAIVHHAELGHENHPPKTLEEFEQALRFRWKYFDHLWTYSDYVIGYQLPSYAVARGAIDTAAWMQQGYRLNPKRLRDIAEATRRAGTWNIPTLTLQEWVWHPRRFDFLLQIIKALSNAGGGLLLGVDRWDIQSGFAIHRELQLLVQAGLTPYQALETGTRNVAVFTGTQDSAGTVAVGKYADLVLLEGNPLKDIRYAAGPAGVMFDGQWLSRADIDARLDAFEAKGCRLAKVRREAWQHLGMSQDALLAVGADNSPDKCKNL